MPVRPVALAVVVGLAVVAAPASASTLTGKVSGAKLPKAGQGITTVRAVNARTLLIADVAKVRSHRYRLKVPAGSYWMFAATTSFRGKPGLDRPSGKVSVRKGKRKKVPVSLRKRKRPRAHAAFVNVKYPAVWVQHFSVSDVAEYGPLRKGIADMLITDLGPPLERACGGGIVEREKLSFLLAEQVFTNPGQLPSTDRMIAHNREVSGSWNVAGGTATLTVNVTNVVTGATRSVTRTGDANRFFELVPSVVQEVVRILCNKPPRYYSGPASGSTSGADGSTSQTLSWTGNVRLKFTGDLESGDPPGEYARYQPESGSFHVTLDGTRRRVLLSRHGRRHDRPAAGRRTAFARAAGCRVAVLLARGELPGRHAAHARDDDRARVLRRRHDEPVRTGGSRLHDDTDREPAVVVLDADRRYDQGHRPGHAQVGVVAGA